MIGALLWVVLTGSNEDAHAAALAFKACETTQPEPAAAACYLRLARAFPADPLAPEALYDALVALTPGDPDGAISLGKELAAKYPKNALAPIALFRASNLAEKQGHLDEAAALAEQVTAGWPATREGQSALRNAMVLRAINGDCAKARTHAEHYLQRVKKGSDDEKAARQVLKRCGSK